MSAVAFTVRDGRVLRDGTPFVAVGVDYHPSAAGCRIWSDWDPDALKRDFREMAEAGLNTVRLFVFWRDFEPAQGRYRPKLFVRLRTAVELAADAGLACVLSVFTIWMNGQVLDLPWRRGRSLWLDKFMLERQEAFAVRVARSLVGLDNVLAFDLGDEIGNVDPAGSAALPREAVAAWHARLAGVLRRHAPGALVTQANDASGVLGASPFGVDNSEALDLAATHGFPTWAPGSIESTTAYKATSLTAFQARFAAAYRPPLVDELGSYGVGEAIAARYLRASAASALANGATGVLAWCWQDIASTAEPYQERPTEREVGLRRLDGSAKPAFDELLRLAAAAPDLIPGASTAKIALYVPELARAGGASYLDGGAGTLATFYAYLLLKRAHLDFDVVAGPLDGYRLVLCPSSVRITLTDQLRLRAHVDAGGTLYCSLGDHLHGFPGRELTGVELTDFTLLTDGLETLRWDDDEWPVDWPGAGVRAEAVAAEPVGFHPDGSPALFVHRLGAGTVVFCTAPYELQLDRPGRLTERDWERWYLRLAAMAGIEPAVACPDPDVEVVPGRAVVINHADEARDVTLTWPDGVTTRVELDAKDWRVVPEGAAS